jgi:hypothetical protein
VSQERQLDKRPFFRKSLAGATSGNRWQIGRPRKRLKQAKTVATGCDQLPQNLDGKEEVTAADRVVAW